MQMQTLVQSLYRITKHSFRINDFIVISKKSVQFSVSQLSFSLALAQDDHFQYSPASTKLGKYEYYYNNHFCQHNDYFIILIVVAL